MSNQMLAEDDGCIMCAEIRCLPLGASGNIHVGRQNYAKEIQHRKEHMQEYGSTWDLPKWEDLEIVFKNGEWYADR